jgi:hypothetical protein
VTPENEVKLIMAGEAESITNRMREQYKSSFMRFFRRHSRRGRYNGACGTGMEAKWGDVRKSKITACGNETCGAAVHDTFSMYWRK